MDSLRWIKNRIKKGFNSKMLKPRENKTDRFKEFLDKQGDKKIVKIEIAREPVQSGVKQAINTLSFGGFEKLRKAKGYDNVWHNFSLVTLEDGTKYRIEKNHVVEERHATENDPRKVVGNVKLGDKNLNLKSMIERAEKDDDDFWKYDPEKSNCQVFISDLVNRNGLVGENKETEDAIVPQDSQAILNSIPSVFRDLPKKITDTARTLDHFVHGGRVFTKLDRTKDYKHEWDRRLGY
jgi:hypothetical protein